MEIKINCNQSINLNSFKKNLEIKIKVDNYKLNNDTLVGDIKIYGKYLTIVKDKEVVRGFEEIVPITVVFRTNEITIDDIAINDFETTELIGKGVDCKFAVEIKYTPIEIEKEKEKEDVIPVPVETTEEIIEVMKEEDFLDTSDKCTTMDVIEEKEELSTKEITKEYDKALEEVLISRNDNFFDDEEQVKECNMQVLMNDDLEANKVSFQKQNEKYCVINVYYIKEDSDIEKIAKIENCSVEKIYQNNQDYQDKNRVIV